MTWKVHLQQDPRLNQWYRRVQGRPGWVWTAAIGAAALVVLLPLVLLTLAAVFVAMVVFTALSLMVAGVRFVQRLAGGVTQGGSQAPPTDGRRNVRVIQRP